MPTVKRRLPERPHLSGPKREARELFEACQSGHLEALERIRRRHPRYIDALDDAAITTRLKLSDAHFITPGRPMENGYIESFHGRFREECLNEHWFLTLDDARETIEN